MQAKKEKEEKVEGYDLLMSLRSQLGFDFRVVHLVTKRGVVIVGIENNSLIEPGEVEPDKKVVYQGQRGVRPEPLMDRDQEYLG